MSPRDFMIPGTATAEEQMLLDRLNAIRKSGGDDCGDPVTAAEQALERLADKVAARDGVTKARAYDDVIQTPQGSRLYSITRGTIAITDPAAACAAIRKMV